MPKTEKKKITRHEARERTVMAVYAILLRSMAEEDIQDIVSVLDSVYQMDFSDFDLGHLSPISWEALDPDFKAVCVKALSHYDEIALKVNEFLDGWTFDRLPTVTQAVMLVCYAETVLVGSCPKEPAINEAVEIVKELSSPSEYRYVNAVLERLISRELGIESDYKGPGKIHVPDTAFGPNKTELEEVLSGEAVLASEKKE